MLLQWKSPSHVFLQHQNPLTYLFRRVLDCFYPVNSAWCVQIALLIQIKPFFAGKGTLLWIEDSYFSWKQWIEDTFVLMVDLFLTNTQLFTSQDINWWTGVVWIIEMFLSAVLTLILTAPIHCRASTDEQVMECNISPNLMKKQTHLHLRWPEIE